MREWPRFLVLAALLAGGATLALVLARAHVGSPLPATLTTAFQVLGAPLKLADRATSRVLPVDALDEASLGAEIAHRLDAMRTPGDADQRYCDQILHELTAFTQRSFRYRVYVIASPGPNAVALPGGVLLVTHDLLRTVHSECELVAVLGHEVGHIERGHCFDAVRFELLARKADVAPLGAFADWTLRFMVGHAYTKTVEHEADDFAFDLLRNSAFDPRGAAMAFRSLLADTTTAHPPGDPLNDYLSTHPAVEVRADEYGQRAAAWWRTHAGQSRYVGRQNLQRRVAMEITRFPGEWVTE